MPLNHVGGETDGYCTRCKMVLAHTVLAMVGERIAKVRCNTCMGEHAFKAAPGESKTRASRSVGRSPVRSRAASATFDEQLASKNTASSRVYAFDQKFELDQVIDHPTFGRGFVASVRGDKIEVVFRNFVKTLVHGRGKPAPAPSAKAE